MNRAEKRVGCLFLAFLVLLGIAGAIGYAVYEAIDSGELTKDFQPVDDTRYDAEIAAAAAKHNIPMALVRAVIRRESRFVADTRGSKGEIGLMQILPSGAGAEWARVNKCPRPTAMELYDVETNLDIGCWYLARALKRWKDYRHGTELALAEYNAGFRNVRKWAPKDRNAEVIPRIGFRGTKEYVTTIMKYYQQELDKKALR